MKKYYTPLGVILTIIGSAVLVISLKARSLADKVLQSLTNEDDLLFEASNRPSISVWEGYRSTGIRIALIVGSLMLICGVGLLAWRGIRTYRKLEAE